MPTYNEEKALPDTLRSLVSQPGDYEVIAVDGGSADHTCGVLREAGFSEGPVPLTPHPSRFLITATKGRASQMNAGAKTAGGEWLLFLHADTVLPEGAIERLNNMETDHAIQAGGFLHQFSGDDWRLKAISFLDNFRCTRSRIIYGDQALFVRRSLFERLGGFPNQPILEDVAFCEKIIKETTPLLLFPPVITDARKFLKMGVWRSFIRVLLIILHVEFRLPVLPRAFFQDIR
ncbi:MAG: glycosyltransferase family 2 protein [Nitrospira sp.]|nr:glycosyltransferase family 2 protein [Nitrospira sp.]